MPLKPLPGQGIELSLDEYTRLRAFQGGGWFWDHENQQVILQCLGEFLPSVKEQPSRAALFQKFVGATEAVSKSHAVGQKINRVPKSQFDRLQRAVETLRQKAQDPQADPNAKRIIEKFRLPDPAKDPDLYRLHGRLWNRRLLILWGCEREPGASLPPETVLSRMPVEPQSAAWLRWLPILLGALLLILLLLLLAHWLWLRNDRRHGRVVQAVELSSPSMNGSGNSGANPALPASPPAAAPNAANASPFAPTPSAMPAPSASVAPNAGSAMPPPRTTNPSPALASASTPTPAASSPIADNSGSPSRAEPLPRASVPPAAATSSPALPPPVGAASPSTPARKAAPNTPAPSRAASPSPAAPTPFVPDPAAKNGASPQPVSAAAPRIGIQYVSGSSMPHEGKMDVTLTVAGYGPDGSAQPLQIERWEIDGAAQQTDNGRALTADRLSTSLPQGIHRARVSGTLGNSVPVSGELKFDVQITTAGNVKILSDGK